MDSILVIIVAMFIIVPIANRMRFKLVIPPQFEPCSLQELSQLQQQYFSQAREALETEGFQFIGQYRGHVRARHALHMALFTHKNGHDRATINFLSHVRWIEFCTEFCQDASIETTNSPHGETIQTPSEKRSFTFPQIRDIHRLYRLHRQLIQKYIQDTDPLHIEDGNELEMLKQSYHKDFERVAKRRHLYFDNASQSYRPTWKGAILMTLRSLVPIRPVLVRHEASKLLKELETSPSEEHNLM